MKIPLHISPANQGVQLNMLVINTNECLKILRPSLDADSQKYYQSCINLGEASLQLPFGRCRFDMAMLGECAVLRLQWGQMPVSVAGVAATQLGAAELWQFMLDLHPERLKKSARNASTRAAKRPEETPWLAVYFTQQFMADADSRSLRHLRELHKILGWAVIDYIAAQQRRN